MQIEPKKLIEGLTLLGDAFHALAQGVTNTAPQESGEGGTDAAPRKEAPPPAVKPKRARKTKAKKGEPAGTPPSVTPASGPPAGSPFSPNPAESQGTPATAGSFTVGTPAPVPAAQAFDSSGESQSSFPAAQTVTGWHDAAGPLDANTLRKTIGQLTGGEAAKVNVLRDYFIREFHTAALDELFPEQIQRAMAEMPAELVRVGPEGGA